MVAKSYSGETQTVECLECNEMLEIPSEEYRRAGMYYEPDRSYCSSCEERVDIERGE